MLIGVGVEFLASRYTKQTGGITTSRKPKAEVEIILAGDVMLGRTVMSRSLDMSDPVYPFRKVGEVLSQADIVFVNLENPILENCPRHYTGFTFCAEPKMIEGLEFAGVDVATLANNRSRNYGERGLLRTKELLEEKGILVTGLGNLAVIEKSGVKFGFLGFDYVDKNITDEDLELVRESDKRVDVLIAGVHWGAEYRDTASAKQNEIAKKLVENGVDLIAGHHPHWVQNQETINGKPVYYSLGNFIFDQMWSAKTREGLAIRIIYNEKGEIVREEDLPVFMYSWAQPEWVE